jgi:hypothetical protein
LGFDWIGFVGARAPISITRLITKIFPPAPARVQAQLSNKHNLVLYVDQELVEKTRNLGFNLSNTFENHLKHLLMQFARRARCKRIGDGTVDIFDAIRLAGVLNSTPTRPNWSPNEDVNGDGTVEIFDAIVLANHYGQTTLSF